MKTLILDIETAPHKVYAWGLWNQNISIHDIEEPGYTLCFAAKWKGSKKIIFDSIFQSTPLEMIEHAWELLNEADAVIHYNGNKFDIPTLNAEYLKYEIIPPDPSRHIDLYRVVKKNFRLPSNKLDYVARWLGIPGKVQHKGITLWHQCMEGDPKAWKLMENYNKQDVNMLEPIYERLLPWIATHPNLALYDEKTLEPMCTNCGSTHLHKKGIETTKVGAYQRYRCTDCGTPLRGRTSIVPKNKRPHILTQSKLL